MAIPIKPNKDYIPLLDGLRGVSILLVLFAHLGLGKYIPGDFGVTIFFFISGFIITRTLLAEVIKNEFKGFSLKQFYLRRFLRLYPALIFLILCSVTYFSLLNINCPKGQIIAALFYYMNYFILLGGVMNLPFGVLWSLSIEEHFYFIYPWVLSKFLQNIRRLIRILILILALVLIWRCILAYGYHEVVFIKEPFWTYISTDCRIDSILYGCLLSSLCLVDNEKTVLKIASDKIYVYCSFVLLLITFFNKNLYSGEAFKYSLQGIALFGIISALLFSNNFNSIRELFETKLLVWIGKISYSLYLWHTPCFGLIKKYMGNNSFSILISMLVLLITSSFSYYCIEKVFRYRHNKT